MNVIKQPPRAPDRRVFRHGHTRSPLCPPTGVAAVLFAVAVFCFSACGRNGSPHTDGTTENAADCISVTPGTSGPTDGQTEPSATRETVGESTALLCSEHVSVPYETVLPTCETSGKTGGSYCAVCGLELTPPEILLSTGHSYVKSPGVMPSCEASGLTEGQYCSVCGQILVGQYRIEPTGHAYSLVSVVTGRSAPKYPDVSRAGEYACEVCGKTVVKTICAADFGVPVISLSGSLSGITGDTAGILDAEITFPDERATLTSRVSLKVQGGTSASFEKKNYNFKFIDSDGENRKVMLCRDWGSHAKYCLKANYVDASHARNVVSGRIYGDIVSDRNPDDRLSSTVNGGAIDGFPTAVFLNGDFLGLYTLNIPKDKWLFGIKDSDRNAAILMGASWTDSVALREHISGDFAACGWDLQYATGDDGGKWVADSMNRLMDILADTPDGAGFRRRIVKYVDVDRAIDTFIFVTVTHGEDNTSKNVNWVTYDGIKWTPVIYDMDDTWGMVWNGQEYYTSDSLSMGSVASRCLLWERLWSNYRDEILNRYRTLRKGPLSYTAIENAFGQFFSEIPPCLYEADAKRWPRIPSLGTSTQEQILTYAKARLNYLDRYVRQKIAQ